MEDDRVPSGSKTTDESYCGLFSVKNPSYLYYDEVNSYFAQTAPQVRLLLVNFWIAGLKAIADYFNLFLSYF